jgi:hypothetical protein
MGCGGRRWVRVPVVSREQLPKEQPSPFWTRSLGFSCEAGQARDAISRESQSAATVAGGVRNSVKKTRYVPAIIIPTLGGIRRLQQIDRNLENIDRDWTVILVINRPGGGVDTHPHYSLIKLPSGREAATVDIGGGGIPRARTAGLRRAKEQYVLFLDDDISVPRGSADQLLRELQAGQADIVSGRVLELENFPEAFATLVSHDRGSTARSSADDLSRYCSPFEVWRLGSGSVLALDRASLDQRIPHGTFFDANFRDRWLLKAGEDLDFLLRALSAGAKVNYRPDIIFFHNDNASVMDLQRKAEAYTRGKAALYWKWRSFCTVSDLRQDTASRLVANGIAVRDGDILLRLRSRMTPIHTFLGLLAAAFKRIEKQE